MTGSEGYLMGRRGPIRVDPGTLTITEDGKVYLRRPGSGTGDDLAGEGELLDELWLADFEDRTALTRMGDSLFEYRDSEDRLLESAVASCGETGGDREVERRCRERDGGHDFVL